MPHYVFIMSSRPGGALYVGMTNDLRRRVEMHRSKRLGDHAAKYNITDLVWFEIHATEAEAAERERRIKGWRRLWKEHLILASNPDWKDITAHIPP